jgi:hypothetical protein
LASTSISSTLAYVFTTTIISSRIYGQGNTSFAHHPLSSLFWITYSTNQSTIGLSIGALTWQSPFSPIIHQGLHHQTSIACLFSCHSNLQE